MSASLRPKPETGAFPSAPSALDRNRKRKLAKIAIGFVLFVYCVVTILPFYFLFIRSFVPTRESTKLHMWIPEIEGASLDAGFGNMCAYYNLNPDQFKQEMGIDDYVSPGNTFRDISKKYNIPEEKILNYLNPFVRFNGWYVIIKNKIFYHSLTATVLLTIASIFIGALFSIATGSVLAGFRKKWHMFVYNSYLVQMIIPSIMIMLPLYLIINKYLNLYDNYLAILMLNVKGGALSTMVFTSYIATIPSALRESVDIDGGNRFHYFFRIILPLSKVPFATYVAITIPTFWNDFLNGILFLSPEKYTLVAFVNSLQGYYASNFQAIFSGLCISLIPIVLLYMVFQNLFVKSALSGAVKG
jgi:ABC-type glycerol-3-phosphate transport system permease component